MELFDRVYIGCKMIGISVQTRSIDSDNVKYSQLRDMAAIKCILGRRQKKTWALRTICIWKQSYKFLMLSSYFALQNSTKYERNMGNFWKIRKKAEMLHEVITCHAVGQLVSILHNPEKNNINFTLPQHRGRQS